jgi:hypothetical protein
MCCPHDIPRQEPARGHPFNLDGAPWRQTVAQPMGHGGAIYAQGLGQSGLASKVIDHVLHLTSSCAVVLNAA